MHNKIAEPCTVKTVLIFVAILTLISLIVSIALFFCEVNSTLSDASWGDVSYYNQIAYNFIHGRPLQSSLYRQGGPGVLNNPFPYVHSFSLHVNFTPYLFIWLYKFMPTVNGFYLITILFNVAGFLGFGWLITQRLFSGKDRFMSYILVCAVFFWTMPFIRVITYKGHFPLFAGPLILAAYYFFLRNNRAMLVLTGLLLCGISEDMAMFMVSFSAYFLIFEKHIRKTALWMGLGSLVYAAIALFVIQPASRYGLALSHTSDSMARLHSMFNGAPALIGFKSCYAFFAGIIAAGALTALFSNFRNEMEWKKHIGLIFIAPATHWFIVMTQGGGHHFIPIMACTFLAFMLVAAKLKPRPVSVMRVIAATLICAAILLPGNMYRLAKNISLYTDAKSITRMETNKNTLREITVLPKNAGICYWTNQGIDAFITSRNDVWRFPEYFDSADYLVIQKDADKTFFDAKTGSSGSIETALKDGKYYSSSNGVKMPVEIVKRIKDELVNVRASHEVKTDTEHVLILKRKESAGLPCPESTIGLGWVRYVGLCIKYNSCTSGFNSFLKKT